MTEVWQFWAWIPDDLKWFTLTALGVVGAGAVGYFFPPLRRYAIEFVALAAVAFGIYEKGYRDAARQKDAKRKADEQRAVTNAQTARTTAEQQEAAGDDDGFDRDKK
jgi:hypothetical protein